MSETLRWWDHWLKDVENGIMDEPQYRVWLHDSEPPKPVHRVRAGRWASEPSWPSPHVTARVMALNGDGLGDAAGPEQALRVSAPATLGHTTLIWCNSGDGSPEFPVDQRPDDALSLCFDSSPLAEDLAILGAPSVHLEIAADRPSPWSACGFPRCCPTAVRC